MFVVLRDINERGRKLDQVLNQYIDLVKPAFEEFTLPVSIVMIIILPCVINIFIIDKEIC